MHQKGGAVPRTVAITLVSAALGIGLSVFPSGTSADTMTVRTQQLLPIGTSVCTPLSVYSFTPYVYDGALHSFEFTASEASYVALAGSVGNTSISFQYMTRSRDSGNSLRVHVDIPTTSISGTLPLTVSLVSAQAGSSVCMSTVSMTVSRPSLGPTVPTQAAPSTVSAAPRPAVIGDARAPGTAIGSSQDTAGRAPVGSTTVVATTSAPGSEQTQTTPTTIASIQNRIVELCLSGAAPRLWMILLIVFAIIAVIAAFGQLPESQSYSLGQRTATILVPLILLLGFWYFSEACRVNLWVPFVAILIALAGLIGVHRDDPRISPYVQDVLKESEEKSTSTSSSKTTDTVMITPPPTTRSKQPPQIPPSA